MNTKIIKFDLNKKLYEKIIAKQGDTKSRFLLFNLLDGAVPFDLTNRSVRAYGLKKDGTEIFNDLIINNAAKGYCTLELTNQMLALHGEVELELMIIEGDKKLTSNIFTLEVRKSINSEKAIVSTNEFTALLNALASLNEYDNYKNEIKEARGGQTKLKNRLDNFDSHLEHIEIEKAEKSKVETLEKRMDSFTSLSQSSTTGDAELMDGRTSYDGQTYNNIGGAIRGQGEKINYDISLIDKNLSKKIMTNNLFTDKELVLGYYYNIPGDIKQNSSYDYFKLIPIKAGINYKIYPRARFISLFDKKREFKKAITNSLVDTGREVSFTAEEDGYVYVTVYHSDLEKIKMYESTLSIDNVLDYNKFNISENITVNKSNNSLNSDLAKVSKDLGIKYLNLSISHKDSDIISSGATANEIIITKGQAEVPKSLFFVYDLGKVSELKGKKIIIYSNEEHPIESNDLGTSPYGGNKTGILENEFTKLGKNIRYFDFDTVFSRLSNANEYNGNIYLYFIDYNTKTIIKDKYTNHYNIAINIPNSLVYIDFLGDMINDLKNYVNQKDSNYLRNKKWVACGDSFTHGDFTGFVDENGLSGEESPYLYDKEWGMYKTYPYQIAKRNGMTLINEAVNGSTMTYNSSYYQPFSYERYKKIPLDTDYITIKIGINDDNKKAPVGTIDDTTNTTFYGAWNVVLDYLITNYPFAKIGVIVTNGSNPSYTEATRKVCRKWGIPYLDLEQDYQVPLTLRVNEKSEVTQKAKDIRMNNFRVSSSNWHPNIKCHEYESTFIENWLRTL